MSEAGAEVTDQPNKRVTPETNLQPPQKVHHGWLLIILGIYLALAGAHSIIVPLTTGNDEWAHFLYVRFISGQGHLPANTAQREEAGYKSDAPPLYHLLVSAATAGVEPARLLRPLSSDAPRRYLADNIIDSYALLHTAVEQWPCKGEVLLWHLGRGLSILFGGALIVITYITGLLIFPQNNRRALLAAALVAFIPAVMFHSSVLSYESLSAALTALFLLAALQALRHPQRWLWWLAMGVLAGLSVTTKYSAVLLPLEIIVVALLAWQTVKQAGKPGGRGAGDTPHPLKFTASRLIISGAAMILAASWWFGFVVWNFNTIDTQGPVVGILQPLLVGDASDTTSVQVAGLLFGADTVTDEARAPLPRNYPQLLRLFIESFWAAPVNGQFLLSPWLPLFFTLLTLPALAGLWPVWKCADRSARAILLLLLAHSLLIVPLLVVRVVASFDPREVAQGRHILLPAASAIAVLLVWGWDTCSKRIAEAATAGLLLWSVFGQLAWAATVYPAPVAVWPKPPPAAIAAAPQNIMLNDFIKLTASSRQVADDGLSVTLWWEATDTAPQDYLAALSLRDATGQVVSAGAGHPVRGRYPTRAWEPGDVVEDTHTLPLPSPLNGEYELFLNLLTRNGEIVLDEAGISLGRILLNVPGETTSACRIWGGESLLRPNASFTVISNETPVLELSGWDSETPRHSLDRFHTFVVGANWPAFGQVVAGTEKCGQLNFDVPPRDFTVPEVSQPLAANFNNQVELLGYQLSTRRIHPGGRLPLTLYWRGLDYMGHDYRIFANPLDAEQQRRGGYDRRPQDGYSTLRWVPGEVITDTFGIPIDIDAPPGIYTVDVGLYQQTETGAESLPLVQGGQPLEQRSVRIGPVKVGGAPPGVVAANPAPQITLNQPFGEQITLLGYDQGVGTQAADSQSPNALNLTLYWQASAMPAADYTTFLHLRDFGNRNVAQKDSPPAAARYPTSLWDSGETIVDEIILPLDDVSPGSYTPVVGLYNAATGERLPTPGNPANEIPLDDVLVK